MSRRCTRSPSRSSRRCARSPTSSGSRPSASRRSRSGFAFPLSDPALFPLGDLKFKSANRPQVRTTANAKDVAAMVRWVKEARGLADLVLVSLHAHEQLGSKDVPAEFIRPSRAR